MARLSAELFRGFAASAGDFDADARSRRANRRRLIVFASVFCVLLLAGLVWDFSRPAIYQATARLDFVPSAAPTPAPTPGVAADDTSSAGQPYSLRDEVQYLTSRTLLSKVWDGLKMRADVPVAISAGDPPATLQSMLTAGQVPGTNIVAIQAEGGQPVFLAAFVEELITDYRAGLDQRFQGGSTTALADAQDEAKKLDASVADKRREVDAFRAKNNIVSLDSAENQVLSEVRGTSTSLNAANEKVVIAEGKLAAAREAEANGRSTSRARDNPTLASLESQAVAIRAELQATARQFTEEYMKIDPHVRELRARQADIDQQLAIVRRDSARGAVQEAQEEVASTRAAAAALRQQVVASQSSVQSFTSNFNIYKALQEQLVHLEQQRQKAMDRVSSLDAGERGRKPKVDVVEPPSVPQSAASPLYARDAALVLFTALVAALLAMGIVELFNRSPRQASTVVVPQSWAPVGMTHDTPTALPGMTPRDALLHDDRHRDDRTIVARTEVLPAPLPRELDDAELAALLAAADPEFRSVMALFLSGLTQSEVVGLRRVDVDRASGEVSVTGSDPRRITLPSNTIGWLPADLAPADAPLFSAGGKPLAEAALDTALLYAAHDAGLDGADGVTPAMLRHTYVAFLLRQGMRFADVARLVGPLPTDRLAAYKRLVPRGPGGPPAAIDTVDRVLPALRDAPA